jgi:glutathione S-transferase
VTTCVLYHNDMSVCAAKVRNALAEKGIPWDGVHLDLRAGDAQRPEYVKLNPNQVVPTLVHEGAVVIESNVILEYIEDRWQQTPLRPADPAAAARMRLWVRQLDDDVHTATRDLSTCVAFRHQHLNKKPEDVQSWLINMVDPIRRERMRAAIELGLDAPQFAAAVRRFERLLDDFERTLAHFKWLAGDNYSLADIAFSPYMIRLRHLGFDTRLAARPRVVEWTERLFATRGYREGVEKWLNPAYLELFARESPVARARIEQMTAAVSRSRC